MRKPTLEDYRRLAESGVIEEQREIMLRECFELWCAAGDLEQRNELFFRAMAINDIADAIVREARKQLEVVG